MERNAKFSTTAQNLKLFRRKEKMKRMGSENKIICFGEERENIESKSW